MVVQLISEFGQPGQPACFVVFHESLDLDNLFSRSIKRKAMRNWGWLVMLIPLTLITSIPLAIAACLYLDFTVFEPPKVTFPGDPYIGLGFPIMSAFLNIPIVVLRYFYCTAEKPRASAQISDSQHDSIQT